MRDWVKGRDVDLPGDPWKLPADCPLWGLDLSLSQASWILATVRSEAPDA